MILEEVAPALRFATAAVTKASRSGEQAEVVVPVAKQAEVAAPVAKLQRARPA